MFDSDRILRPDWPLVAVSVGVLLLYVGYAVGFIFFTPYPGFAVTGVADGWQVNDSFRPEIEVGEVLLKIGDLTYEEVGANHYLAPFNDYAAGDAISITNSDGTERELTVLSPGLSSRLRRGFATLWFFPFWLAGTIVLLFLRPRDNRWRLLVAFMYLTAFWFLMGSLSSWRTGGARVLLGIVTWLMVPVYLHLHLTVPSDLLMRRSRIWMVMLYGVALLLAVLELFSLVSNNLPYAGLFIAIVGSYGLIVYRITRKASPASEKIAARLMLAGIGLGFGPGVAMFMLPLFVSSAAAGVVGLGISLISIPLVPFFYTYAIYKRQLGTLEFRVSRLLAIYSFTLIVLTIFVGILLFGEQRIASAGARTALILFASAFFVLGTPPLLKRFQRSLNRLAYGTEHDPADILRVFAQRIPSSLTSDSLVDLLTEEVIPTLLIRQSALYTFENEEVNCLYADGVSDGEQPQSLEQLSRFLPSAGRYRAPLRGAQDELSWARLPVALIVRGEPIGLWLFGRRDPDDFYPQDDIELLETLANQIGPVIENIRLYETLKDQADHLAEEVADRTAELREERDRTQAILDSAGEGIFFTDTRGVVLYSNPALAILSGFRQDELIGKTLDLWQPSGASEEAYRQLWSAIYSGTEWGGELLLRRGDGTQRDVRLKIAPIVALDDRLSGFVGVQSDISSLKEIDRLKSSIISSVSHELKTPLTTIKTYLMLLQRGKPEKRSGYLDVLTKETERLTNIIEDLLDLSALDTGNIPINPEPMNLEATVEDIMVRFRGRAEAKNIDFKFNVPANLPPVLADGNQIAQVLSNLVANALNYTGEGGQVLVDCRPGILNGSKAVWVRVQDNGPGISVDELPLLFDRFYRGKAAQHSLAPGTGLGLSICKEIILRHNGEITVESEPGLGATFSFGLPASEQKPPVAERVSELTSTS